VLRLNPLSAQESPDDSLSALRPAEGVVVSLWANKPMVNNPTSVDIDSRGRVWIAEGLNYRMKQRTFEGLDRIEKADRIKILSDTNGDGKADTVTVFAEEIFPVPLGLVVEEIRVDGKQTGTRVYVGNSPDLLMMFIRQQITGDFSLFHPAKQLFVLLPEAIDHALHIGIRCSVTHDEDFQIRRGKYAGRSFDGRHDPVAVVSERATAQQREIHFAVADSFRVQQCDMQRGLVGCFEHKTGERFPQF